MTLGTGYDQMCWIGIRYLDFKLFSHRKFKESDKYFYTSSRTKLEFQNWGRNQPRKHKTTQISKTRGCVVSFNGQWYNDDCEQKYSFICEFV